MDRALPVSLGGLFIGVLSALPLVSYGNCCCCVWIVSGGVIAVYLRQQKLVGPVDAAEGALVGLLAGVVGGILGALLSIPFERYQQDLVLRILETNPDFPAEMRDMMQRAAGEGGGAFRAAAMVLNVLMSSVFGLLGGLLGVAIFKKNAPPQPPAIIPHDPGVAM